MCFADFWRAYPRKVNKANAQKAFAKVAPDSSTVQAMLQAILDQGLQAKCDRGEERYVPHAATWLNGKRWQDEPSGALARGFIGSAEGRSPNGVAL